MNADRISLLTDAELGRALERYATRRDDAARLIVRLIEDLRYWHSHAAPLPGGPHAR